MPARRSVKQGLKLVKQQFKSGTAVPFMKPAPIVYAVKSHRRCAKSQFVKLLETA